MTTTPTAWSATAIYTAGMEVLIDGVLYVANWWTSGDNPVSHNGVSGTGQPWTIVPKSATVTVPAAPTNLAVTATTSSTVTLHWSAGSTAGSGTATSYAIYENGTQVGTVSGTVTSFTVTGLAEKTAYAFTVKALDSAGASPASTAVTATTPAGIIPNAPTGLTETSLTSTSVALTWTAPATPAGATLSGYSILKDGKVIATTTGTSFTVTGLTAATSYSFTVEAIDQYGASKPSTALAVKTAAASSASSGNSSIAEWNATTVYTSGDQVQENGIIYKAGWWTKGDDPLSNTGVAGSGKVWTVAGKVNTTPSVPDAPKGLTATATSDSKVSLAWTAATVQGSGTVSNYLIFENGTQIASTTNTYYTVSGLTAATAYKFSVEAVDATGASAQSSAVSATTLTAGSVSATATFSPYLDVSLYGTPTLVNLAAASGVKNFTLAFIQSSGTNTIGWAGTGSITSDTQPDGSTIQSQVKALQAQGGSVTISFGGAAGTDPAVAAASNGLTAAQLQAEYQSVINRYGVSSLDFDIEGGAIANTAANALRDAAIKGLEAANPGLTISYTLPVLPTGLDYNGLAVINAAVKDGVSIDVINIMAMDYGSSVDNGGAMGQDAIDAIKATEKQLATAGLHAKIGVTPMIGVNDTAGEVFTLADAQKLASYVATDPNVTRVSMWSISRDNGSDAGHSYASATGSGLTQDNYAFSAILSHA